MLPFNCKAILIGCGAEKQATAAPAADLYTSTFFKAKRDFARSTGLPWAILSAEHGLLQRDVLTEPYNKRAEDFTRWQRREWAARVALDLFAWQRTALCVAVIAGEAYLHPLAATLDALDVEVFNPCKGLGLGQQIAWLKNNTAVNL